ncbi:MAG TPA: hemolysin family protein [Flavobacterium sp.]|mgnify:CR=1 FL=1|jgi:CBS domain containing-hemolysin-like protein|uniref:hemolysin family protein n=1 Tax=Flavobacterium sp. TaxID=239 RepID=UPI002D16B167|nr:hemolysin family protein [Flavobacterium sp.]MCA0349994.1 hemolysin family protein [Bacteroidota bacterium]HPW97100.1 hemolysin family protein [Flavobacterium sp.]HQA73555.1 hemolysin family protein [Flavobacterium sp.]
MEIGIIILCLILSAFFSGMEIAFVSSNKIYLEIEKKQDDFLGTILSKITKKPSKFIATMLVGNNISIVIYGFFMGDLILKWFENFGFHFTELSTILLQTIISTTVILMTAEFLPKVFFQIYANSFMKFFALPAYIFYQLFYYISSFMIWISDFILKKFFKTDGDQINLTFSKVELGNYITEQMNAVNDEDEVDTEIQMFQNALEFAGVKAREIMTPRTEMVAVDLYSSVAELRKLFIETGYSKILVYQNTLDDIVGYIHSFELFKKPRSVKSIMISVEFVPETIFIKDVMSLLTKKRKSVAIVLDEYGGTSGIVTMEDIVEELFGEIEDEHDQDEALVETQIDESTYMFSTRLDVEYINQEYKLNIPESDSYGTLGGFIVDFASEIPQKGEKITIGNYQFIIEEATNKKIELVKMTLLD